MDELPCTLVVPVYRNAGSLSELLDEVVWLGAGLDGGLEAIFVVDGSPDDSLLILRGLLEERSIAAR